MPILFYFHTYISIDMLELFGRDEAMQIWVLCWILIGVFANYLRIKHMNKKIIEKQSQSRGLPSHLELKDIITLKGIAKKLIIGLLAWGIFLTYMTGIEDTGYVQVIVPAITFGLTSEVIVGGWLQQKLEARV